MRGVLLATLLAVVSGPGAQGLWLGRLSPNQLLGSWYILAVASGERGFVLERATKSVEGVVVTLTPGNRLQVRSSRHRLERCELSVVELLKQKSSWVFENPSLGVMQYRVLGTNFRDFAVVLTQLESGDEAFNTLELYSGSQAPCPQAAQSWPARRPCASLPNGARAWASSHSSRPSCSRTSPAHTRSSR
ncbi:epididymal-specific lipocalin-6 isoform X1 [Talpa occidentalis]|uniref:epididymal-specific lipocalin-6 isoform X1 n=1 Tax=Talpa occidentalis TaxID=50954 RepID=UPI0023F794AD|nr:epididymal-specific lipocalin-6 isoform X1 [Talpa occidentalis]